MMSEAKTSPRQQQDALVHFPGSGKRLLVLLCWMSSREWWLLLWPDNTRHHSSRWQDSTFTSPLWRLGLAVALQADSKVTTSNRTSSIFSSCFCGRCSQKCFTEYVSTSIKLPVNNCDKNPTGAEKETLRRSPDSNSSRANRCISQTSPANLNMHNWQEMFKSADKTWKWCGSKGCYWSHC